MEDQPLPPGDDAPEGASIYDVLHAAATHHQAGRLAQAEALYRAVLARHPDNRDANHNLGVLAMQSGVPVERALVHFRTAASPTATEGSSAGHRTSSALPVFDPQRSFKDAAIAVLRIPKKPVVQLVVTCYG